MERPSFFEDESSSSAESELGSEQILTLPFERLKALIGSIPELKMAYTRLRVAMVTGLAPSVAGARELYQDPHAYTPIYTKGDGDINYFAYSITQQAIGTVSKLLIDSLVPDKVKAIEKIAVYAVIWATFFGILAIDVLTHGRHLHYHPFALAATALTQSITYAASASEESIAKRHLLSGRGLADTIVAQGVALLQKLGVF